MAGYGNTGAGGSGRAGVSSFSGGYNDAASYAGATPGMAPPGMAPRYAMEAGLMPYQAKIPTTVVGFSPPVKTTPSVPIGKPAKTYAGPKDAINPYGRTHMQNRGISGYGPNPEIGNRLGVGRIGQAPGTGTGGQGRVGTPSGPGNPGTSTGVHGTGTRRM